MMLTMGTYIMLSLLLSRDLARLVGVPFRSDALHRVRSTLPQVGLSDAERARNLKRAFQCKKPAAIKGLHVLLVDDVMTTGSTVASAAEALLEGGALRVSVLTLARAVTGPSIVLATASALLVPLARKRIFRASRIVPTPIVIP